MGIVNATAGQMLKDTSRPEKKVSAKNFSSYLDSYGIQYKMAGHQIRVGQPTNSQGWILHISLVISQVEQGLRAVLPELASRNVPFAIPYNLDVSSDLLNGHLGKAAVGKVFEIYPPDVPAAIGLAQALVELTRGMKGPYVLTDVHLGGTVYCCYGGISPVIQKDGSGHEQRLIYDGNGRLVPDPSTTRFSIPPGIQWPFQELASPVVPGERKILHSVYKPIDILKTDIRGNVYKSLYLKSLFNVKTCVIKQGLSHMASDSAGRDIYDRLEWQKELYGLLKGIINMPAILDFFTEDGNAYLVMDYIKGVPLHEKVQKLNHSSTAWPQLDPAARAAVIGYLLGIIEAVAALHGLRIVHRDVVPGNFLVAKDGTIWLIDMELAYSMEQRKPEPPFEYGTAGFMSPEQRAIQTPTEKEDIFGLGATLLHCITGIPPVKFDMSRPKDLAENIFFLTGSDVLTRIIVSSLAEDPSRRISAKEIGSLLEMYDPAVAGPEKSTMRAQKNREGSGQALMEAIRISLRGLAAPPVVSLDGIWFTSAAPKKEAGIYHNKEFIALPGAAEGVSGVLYTLARASLAGAPVDLELLPYLKAWSFVIRELSKENGLASFGLHDGSAGAALAMAEGIKAGLLAKTQENRLLVENWFAGSPGAMDIAAGIAGQGCALLQCRELLAESFFVAKMTGIVNTLLSAQQKDGSWDLPGGGKSAGDKKFSFSFGTPGILYFLMEAEKIFPSAAIENALTAGLQWMVHRGRRVCVLLDHAGFQEQVLSGRFLGDEQTGFLLPFIRGFQRFKDQKYKSCAEALLSSWSPAPAFSNFSQWNGLPGLGELYLEAWDAFQNQEWKRRAEWIGGVLLHTLRHNESGGGYWQMHEYGEPTAGLMTGNCGIIHFLLRLAYPGKTRYRLLR